jgi:signal transduction histidine kinase/CheY-like chemotaxis protein
MQTPRSHRRTPNLSSAFRLDRILTSAVVWERIDRLAGARRGESDAQLWRGRFITTLTIIGALASLVLGAAHALAGDFLNGGVSAGGVVFCVGLQFVWRKQRSATLIANAFGMFASALYFAGFVVHRERSMVAWLAVMPLLVLFLGGRKLGLIWLAIESVLIGLTMWITAALPRPPNATEFDPALLPALMVVIFTVGLVFDLSAHSVLTQLRDANEAKTRFLANVSHELRTPLNGVVGMAELMSHNELSPAQRERLGVVLQSAQLLRLLIDDVLDATQLERGKLEITEGPVLAGEVVKTVFMQLQSLADAKRLSLALELHGTDDALRTDALRLMQVVSNLVGNALKYTQQGGVTVVVRTSREGEDVRAVIEVRDTGAGISPDELKMIFTPFTRLKRDALVPGTGLGLSIVKAIGDLLGGTVSVRSELGVGSSFCFELVRPRAELVKPAPAADVVSLRVARVLLVDDNAVNLRVAKGLLEKLGCTVTTAKDGADALVKFAPGAFELVLMDLHMPVMDGFASAKEIRVRDAAVCIFALTASTVREELDAVEHAGMNGYLSKPVRLDQLRDAIPLPTLATPASERQSA